MLVFGRKAGERIHIGGNIAVTVLNSNSKRVRLGITAPREISICRKEVYERAREENAREK